MGYDQLSEYPRGIITQIDLSVLRTIFAAGLKRKIAFLLLANTSGAAITITIQSAGGGTIYGSAVVPANDTVEWPAFFAHNGLEFPIVAGGVISGAYWHPGKFQVV